MKRIFVFLLPLALLALVALSGGLLAQAASNLDCPQGYVQIQGWSSGFCRGPAWTAALTATPGEVNTAGSSDPMVDIWVSPNAGSAPGYAFYQLGGSEISECTRVGSVGRFALPRNTGVWGLGPCDPPPPVLDQHVFLPLVCLGCTPQSAPPPPVEEVPLAYVEAAVPTSAVTGEGVTVEAWVVPDDATLPITFTLEADGLSSIVKVVETTLVTFTLEWSTPGWKYIEVSAENTLGPADWPAVAWIEVGAPPSNLGLELSEECLVLHECWITAHSEGTWPLTYTVGLPDAEPIVRDSTSPVEFFEIKPSVSGPYTVTLTVENQFGQASASEVFEVYACPEWLGVTQTMAGGDPWPDYFCGGDEFNAAAQATGVPGEIELAESATLSFWVNPKVYLNGGTFWPLTPGNWHSVPVAPGLNEAFLDTLGVSPSRWGFTANP